MSKKLICVILSFMLLIPFSYILFSCKKDYKLPTNGTESIVITEEQSKALLFNDNIEIKVEINILYNNENNTHMYLFGQSLDNINGDIYWHQTMSDKGVFKKVNNEYVHYVFNDQTNLYEQNLEEDDQTKEIAYARCFNPVYGYLYEINDTKYNGHLTKKSDEIVCVNGENRDCYTYEFYDEASIFNGKEKIIEKFYIDKTYGIILKRTINSYTDKLFGNLSGSAIYSVTELKRGDNVVAPVIA